MNAILDTIVAGLRSSLPGQEARVPIPQLQTSPHYDVPCLSLVDYLTRPDKNGIIAEFKRASPSRGAYRLDADLSETTRGYMQSGCSGLSILTEPDHFQGSLEDLRLARRLHLCPILRKDFMLEPYQVHEARSAGADVILLIAALLDKAKVEEMVGLAHDLGMEVLFECHSVEDLDLWTPGIDMVGVNSRNLSTLDMDAHRFERMVSDLPKDSVWVAESGMRGAPDIAAARALGYSGFLIGDAFLRNSLPHQECARIVRALTDVKEE